MRKDRRKQDHAWSGPLSAGSVLSVLLFCVLRRDSSRFDLIYEVSAFKSSLFLLVVTCFCLVQLNDPYCWRYHNNFLEQNSYGQPREGHSLHACILILLLRHSKAQGQGRKGSKSLNTVGWPWKTEHLARLDQQGRQWPKSKSGPTLHPCRNHLLQMLSLVNQRCFWLTHSVFRFHSEKGPDNSASQNEVSWEPATVNAFRVCLSLWAEFSLLRWKVEEK